MEKALVEEARLIASRARLLVARAELATYGVNIHGAALYAFSGIPSVKVDDEDAADS